MSTSRIRPLRSVIHLLSFVAVLGASPARGQDQLTVATVRLDQPGPTVNRNIYGHFAEHLGRCIYEGIWVGEDSAIPNTRGIRNDVVAALKDLEGWHWTT